MTISPALFRDVTVTVVRDRKIRTALRTNQIAGFVTVPSWKKIKTSIAVPARVILFWFTPLSNSQEDLKFDVKRMAMWKRNCSFGFSSRYEQNYSQLDAQPCFLVNVLNGQLTLLRGQLSRPESGRSIEVRRYV